MKTHTSVERQDNGLYTVVVKTFDVKLEPNFTPIPVSKEYSAYIAAMTERITHRYALLEHQLDTLNYKFKEGIQ